MAARALKLTIFALVASDWVHCDRSNSVQLIKMKFSMSILIVIGKIWLVFVEISEHLHAALDTYLLHYPKVRLIRSKERLGLMRARNLGARVIYINSLIESWKAVAFFRSFCTEVGYWEVINNLRNLESFGFFGSKKCTRIQLCDPPRSMGIAFSGMTLAFLSIVSGDKSWSYNISRCSLWMFPRLVSSLKHIHF